MTKRITPDEADRFMRRLKLVMVAFAALVLLPLLLYAVYLDRRLDDFEATLQHSPPQELEVDESSRSDLHQVTANPVEGQLVYVPAYSHIYHGDGEPYLLTITLSVRNTSLSDGLVVKSVRYFDTKGNEIKTFLEQPVRLPALGTTEVVVERDDATGGSGANFLVEWYASKPVTEPIIEAVMIDTKGQQGISFARRGSVISQVEPQANANKVENGGESPTDNSNAP